MNVGARVILQRDWLPCKAGSRGIIQFIDQDGGLTVKITHNHEGTPFTFLIAFAPQNYFTIS